MAFSKIIQFGTRTTIFRLHWVLKINFSASFCVNYAMDFMVYLYIAWLEHLKDQTQTFLIKTRRYFV